ncbi:MAG: hypothetical protein WKG01_17340 [Kofleriaceae bacterium]
MRLTYVAAMILVGGCENNAADVDAAIDIDAPPSGPCWPDLVHVPKGSATVGTGRDGFESMPEDLPLDYGNQDGFMLIANAKMTGFDPGNPNDNYDARNPRTRIRAYFDDTGVPLNFDAHCPFRYPYLPAGSSEYALTQSIAVIFEVCWRSTHLFDKRIRVEMEIMDNEGGFTTDVKVVTARAPLGPHAVDDGPGCMH